MPKIEVFASLQLVIDGQTRTITTPRYHIDDGGGLDWAGVRKTIDDLFADISTEMRRHDSPESVLTKLPG